MKSISVLKLSFLGALFLFTALLVQSANALEIKKNSIYQSKFTWEDQNGKTVHLSQLRGQPVVMAMAYTSCQASCPMIMSDLKAIEAKLPADKKQQIRFAIFSFDSVVDVPKHLKAFSEKQEVDTTRWNFFHGSVAAVQELAALLGVRVRRLKDGGFDHSNVISILDRDGVLIHQQKGLRQPPDESVAVLLK